MNIRLLVWVTSKCNLSCPLCSQKYARNYCKDYEMELLEVSSIVKSLKERNIKINTIELTGGEPSLWQHLEEGIKLFKTVADNVTLITNGNNPERIKALGLSYWFVSQSQATPKQLSKYIHCHAVLIKHKHKKPPEKLIKNSLPAECCVAKDHFGKEQNSLLYFDGDVFYCCYAFALTKYVRATPKIVCNFEDDFITRFKDKKFDQEICKYCICNGKVWSKI